MLWEVVGFRNLGLKKILNCVLAGKDVRCYINMESQGFSVRSQSHTPLIIQRV